jgi:DNA topoisomerase-6 subunit B
MLTPTAFTTSRLLEFCSSGELTKLVGFDPEYWPVVAVKELIDNSLDACEDGGIRPEINIAISTTKGVISVEDKGPGIAPETVAHLLDYSKKTSSREAYVGPSRGQQGNALQALLAMPFALDGERGESTIICRGITHHIVFGIDQVRREPRFEHEQKRSLVQNGTRITLHWPVSA